MVELGEFPVPHQVRCARLIARKFSPFGQDDVSQDALVAMWSFDRRFRTHYDDIDQFFAGCYVAGVRGAIDGIRKREGRRKGPGPAFTSDTELLPLADHAPSVEDLATGAIDIYAAARRIAKRTKDHRIIDIVRRLDEGATKDTIAHELHIDPARVSQLLKPLKRLLEAAA